MQYSFFINTTHAGSLVFGSLIFLWAISLKFKDASLIDIFWGFAVTGLLLCNLLTWWHYAAKCYMMYFSEVVSLKRCLHVIQSSLTFKN